MIDVIVSAHADEFRQLHRAAQKMQERFHFIDRSAVDPDVSMGASTGWRVHLSINDRPDEHLFSVDEGRGILVSTWQCEGICLYAGIPRATYLLLSSLLGLTQWRALCLNPLLRIEDFVHPEPSDCLFSSQPTKQDCALLLESPKICRGCRDFYHCLGTDQELIAVKRTLAAISKRLTQRSRFSQGSNE